jgi:gamma-glutamyltranspeptidase
LSTFAGVGESQSDKELESSRIQLEYGYGGRYDGGADDDYGENMRAALTAKGHDVLPLVTETARTMYGRAQIIVRNRVSGVLSAGSDPRADGCAMAAL